MISLTLNIHKFTGLKEREPSKEISERGSLKFIFLIIFYLLFFPEDFDFLEEERFGNRSFRLISSSSSSSCASEIASAVASSLYGRVSLNI